MRIVTIVGARPQFTKGPTVFRPTETAAQPPSKSATR